MEVVGKEVVILSVVEVDLLIALTSILRDEEVEDEAVEEVEEREEDNPPGPSRRVCNGATMELGD